MLFNVSRGDELRPWLISTLEPICDADPEVLADYVIALLRHDGEEQQLRTMFASQLEDFLDQEAPAFVDRLFTEMNHRGMIIRPQADTQPTAGPSNPIMPPSLPTPPDEGIPIPLDMLAGPSSSNAQVGQKRGRNSDDMDVDRGPPKGPRLGNGLQGIQRYESRNQNGYGGLGPGGQAGGNWRAPSGPRSRGRGGRGMRGGAPGPGRDGREPCRDFHERGYCARGMGCPYSHGDDMAMVPPMMPFFMPGLMPGMPGMPMPVPGPNGELQFPMMPNMFGMSNAPGQISNGNEGEYDPSQAQMPISPTGMGMLVAPSMGPSSEDQDMDSGDGAGRGRGRGGFRGRGRGRGRDGPIHGGAGFRPSPEDKTLLVEKIPSEHLSLNAIREQFKKHGTITNIAVDARGAKAMVTFATHDEAQRAHRDPEPVFGSRFVKLLWHRPLEGKGGIGQQMLEKSKVLVENMNNPKPPAPAPVKPPPAAQDPHAALAARSQLLDKHLAEQKTLMEKFEKAATPAEKKEILLLIKKNDQQMKALKDTPLPTAPAATAATAPHTGAAPVSREAQMKERLDKELDLQNSMDDIKNGEANPELLAQLAQLREEARNAGVPLDANGRPIEQPAPAYTPGYSRPYVRGRGRGRARGWRGGPPVYHQSMKLDLRPKRLVVSGVASGDETALAAVRNFYVTSGGLESFEPQPDGTIQVKFFSRSAAELAMSKGNSIPSAGAVSVSWPPPSAPPSSSQPASSSVPGSESSQPAPSTQESQEVERQLVGGETQDGAEHEQGEDDPWATSQDIVVDE
ncbi:hypothetical protein CALCODRAFT_494995 [Calocera cornea HHB12733]|uniref:C3H1-type domain-containing protein n=1 Tax=Calocera cornea HHB12733 TaxID=1353952 RepID=A0A165GU38_9BASI|nr:hypothetical protein CALCODRAFT_494995 [Calocera cornea HHB12733]